MGPRTDFISVTLLMCAIRLFMFVHAALRALRTLRSISFIRGLQVLVRALIDTFRSAVLHLLLLLFILMFIFAIIGYNFFGYVDGGDQRNWGNFGVAMLSLFNFVTVRCFVLLKFIVVVIISFILTTITTH